MMCMEDDPISVPFVFEYGVVSTALQRARGLQNRVVLRFGPGAQGVIRCGVPYAVMGAFVAVGRLGQIVCVFMADYKRTFVY